MRSARIAGIVTGMALAASPAPASAVRVSMHEPNGIRAGTTELGVAGSIVAGDGTALSLGVRGGRFLPAAGTLLSLEAEAGWDRVRELDGLDLLASLQWTPWPDGSVLPFGGVVGGLRQEWVGSFRRARGPVGVLLGVRALAGRSAALRVEYRFLRLTGDSLGAASEHRVRFGVSLLLGNRATP